MIQIMKGSDEMNDVKICSKDGVTHIYVNGKELDLVKYFCVKQTTDDSVPLISVEFYSDIEIEGEYRQLSSALIKNHS